MTPKEKAQLHYDLMQILTSCEDDKQFYNRLLYAKQLIENSLSEFKDDEIEVEDDYYGEYMGF